MRTTLRVPFLGDFRFILQRESTPGFDFSLILSSDLGLDRVRTIQVLHAGSLDICSVVTGTFLVNDVINHLNHCVVVGKYVNSQAIHDNEFLVGNHYFDMSTKAACLYQAFETV
ncbi:hypothetical protein [Mariprofundus ferrooxydans]|uniref:hypothetical protein n=1 Tax=Mariprofundus ferrooxydans TaxID=314344 RepID=UPI000373B60E|nr:hypothetical protein [Mariprofundus ferrooxydans]